MESPRKLFLAYKEGAEGTRLGAELCSRLKERYDVFFAKSLAPGSEWPEASQKSLEQADVFVALMTRDACDSSTSDFLPHEIDVAARLYKEARRPLIIPVRVAHLTPYDYRIGARLARFQEIYLEDAEDVAGLVRKITGALDGRPAEPEEFAPSALGPYRLPESARRRLASAYVNLPALQRSAARLEAGDLVWLTGDAGARNFAAQSLAARDGREVYSIPRTKPWTEVSRILVSDATLIFADALPSADLADEATAGEHLAALANLLSRRNRILLTAPAEEIEEALFRLRQMELRRFHHEKLPRDAYGPKEKRCIFTATLDELARSGAITPRQHSWVATLLSDGHGPQAGPQTENRQRFLQNLEKWSPADIERFLLRQVPGISKPVDLTRALQRNASLEDEIHDWFLALSDSVKCFVLTVALVPGLDPQQAWHKYRSVFQKLRSFDPQLALWPIGLSRERASPYVTADGAVEFIEEIVGEAVRREIARSYREYLVELLPELQQWTVGADTQENAPAGLRSSIAGMIGDAGRISIADILPLLQVWADQEQFRNRILAAEAFERIAGDASGRAGAFQVLDYWAFSPGQSKFRLWTAVTAYGRIALLPEDRIARQAMEQLGRLAADPRERVTDYVALAATRLPRRFTVNELEPLLLKLAPNGKRFTRINLAEALNEIRVAAGEDGRLLFNAWLGSAHLDLRGIAAISLIIQGKRPQWRKLSATSRDGSWEVPLQDLLDIDGETVAEAFCDAAAHQIFGAAALTALARLAARCDKQGSSQLIRMLASVLARRTDRELLAILREQGSRFDRLRIAIVAEMDRQLLAKPETFLQRLDAAARQPESHEEAYRALDLLAQPEPQGERRRVISALASCFSGLHSTVEEVFAWLRVAPSLAVSSLPRETRKAALTTLLNVPELFVQLVHSDWAQVTSRTETWEVLTAFAQAGSLRASLVAALANAHPAATKPLEELLEVYKIDPILQSVAADAWIAIVNTQLARPAELLRQLRTKAQGRHDRLDALAALADRNRPSRQRVIKSLAAASQRQPAETVALLNDMSFRSRDNLKHLWIWVKLERFLQALGISSFER